MSYSKRGVVISNKLILNENSISIDSRVDLESLLFCILFWDDVVWPASNHFYVGDPACEFLENAGAIRRMKIELSTPWDPSKNFQEAYTEAFEQLDVAEPGAWAVCSNSAPFVNWKKNVQIASYVFSLYDALSIPSAEAPHDEVLEFKRKRYDNLIDLRLYMDRFIADLGQSDDPERLIASKLDEVQKRLADHSKVVKEQKFTIKNIGIRMLFNVPGQIAAVGGAFFGAKYGMPELGSLIGGTVGASIAPQSGSGKASADLLRPFEYVTRIQNELLHPR